MKVCPRCSDLLPDDASRCPRDDAALRPVLDPLIGKTIGGRYRLISRLGTGGMSSVYLARHVMIDRLMAIKTLRRDLAQDPVQRDRFIREARAVNRINHTNIVEITDFGETDDGLVYLVMEYVPGESLLKVMQGGPLPAGRALHIAQQIASALARAHQMGIIHRDLKPENVLLVSRKEDANFVKVLDFGIAKIMDAPSLTGSQQIFGTPGYIAPEYIQSTDIDGRTDLYSLGVILYELTTGALPFDYEYPGDLLVKHVTEPPIAPSVRLPSIEPPLETLILRCLEKEPANRFRDAHHFLEELELVRERLGPANTWGAMSEPAPPVGASGAPNDTLDETDGARPVRASATPVDGAQAPADEDRAPEEAPARDTLIEAIPAGRPVTQEYSRLSIPQPPAVERVQMPMHATAEAGAEEARPEDPSRHTPSPSSFDPEQDGILGVRRWRKRHDAIADYLRQVGEELAIPSSMGEAMSRSRDALSRFESRAAQASQHQQELEAMTTVARGVRAELGRSIDALAGELSRERGTFEELVGRRNALRDRREGMRRKLREGHADPGNADAQLWELAAVDEEVRGQAARCDDLEARLGELRGQLDARSEAAEAEQMSLVVTLDAQMLEIESLAASLREPLETAERFVLEHWEELELRAGSRQQTPPEAEKRS